MTIREKQKKTYEKHEAKKEVQSGRGEDNPGGRDEVEGPGGAVPEPPERDRRSKKQDTEVEKVAEKVEKKEMKQGGVRGEAEDRSRR